MANKRLTEQEVQERLGRRSIRLVNSFTEANSEGTFECLNCKHTWKARLNNVMYGRGSCPECGRPWRLSQEQAEQRINKLYEGSIKLVSEYKGYRKKANFKCYCGKVITSTYGNMVANKKPCPQCDRELHNILYLWRFVGTNLYKFGITSERCGTNRIKYCAQAYNTDYEIVVYRKTLEAPEIESIIKDSYTACAVRLHESGGTEILELSDKEATCLASLMRII